MAEASESSLALAVATDPPSAEATASDRFVAEASAADADWAAADAVDSASAVALAAVLTGTWWMLIFYPLIGYGFAWVGHFRFERNRPATFDYPRWSLMGDYKMLWLYMTGRLDDHLHDAVKKYGKIAHA